MIPPGQAIVQTLFVSLHPIPVWPVDFPSGFLFFPWHPNELDHPSRTLLSRTVCLWPSFESHCAEHFTTSNTLPTILTILTAGTCSSIRGCK
jgi:hypothetical protein